MSEVLNVAQRGEGVLTLVASPVLDAEFSSQWLHAFVDALIETMLARQGVGIAAPQVYLSKRIIIIASRPNLRYPDAPWMEPIVMINPEIIAMSEQQTLGEEGCLSVQGQRAQVARATWLKVGYRAVDGTYVEADYSGFVARIVQHEIDHLDGVLFTDRVQQAILEQKD